MQKTCKTCTWSGPQSGLFCFAPNGQCFIGEEFTCDSWESCETPLLVDVLAKLVRETRQLAISEGWKAPPPWWKEIDAALARHQQEI